MPTYERCPPEIPSTAALLCGQYSEYAILTKAKVQIDFLFARADRDDKGELLNDAIRKNGVKALGLCKVMSLKDRAAGRGDAEILLDADWWADASAEEQLAVLDHELYHLVVREKNDKIVTDDLNRPKLRIRAHDHDYGWFDIIAIRHGKHSQECKQATLLADQCGQLYFTQLDAGAVKGTVTIRTEEGSTTVSAQRFSQIAQQIKNQQPEAAYGQKNP